MGADSATAGETIPFRGGGCLRLRGSRREVRTDSILDSQPGGRAGRPTGRTLGLSLKQPCRRELKSRITGPDHHGASLPLRQGTV
jgi:hypothetical protein